jgi:hypothetical protein
MSFDEHIPTLTGTGTTNLPWYRVTVLLVELRVVVVGVLEKKLVLYHCYGIYFINFIFIYMWLCVFTYWTSLVFERVFV